MNAPWVLLVLVPLVLLLNFYLWRRRGRGWRTHVDALIRVVQPHVPEPVLDVVVLQPAGTVGRQARAEQGRGVASLAGGLGGEVSGALASFHANEAAEREQPPPFTALAVTSGGCFLLPVSLAGGWSAGPVELGWDRGEAAYAVEGRALTIQLSIRLPNGWTHHYETARDPAGYTASVIDRLTTDR